LALEGPVQFVSGTRNARSSVRLSGAPFDDFLVLFASRHSESVRNLLATPRCEVLAGGSDFDFQLRMYGRAVCTGSAVAHPRRMELVHWLPEGRALHQLCAIEFYPERIEFTEGGEGRQQKYQGDTAAAEIPGPSIRWLHAAFKGIWPAALLAAAAAWIWIGWFGQYFRLQYAALFLAVAGALSLMGGARLVYRSTAFLLWQRGKQRRVVGGVLSDGWLAQRSVALVGWLAMGAGALSIFLLAAIWGERPALMVPLASQIWYLGPIWGFQLLQRPSDGNDGGAERW